MIYRRRVELLTLFMLLIVAAGVAVLFVDRQLDLSYVTYRYARNLAAGRGFAYNPGEPVLSNVVAPLYVLILSLGANLVSDLPQMSNLIGSLAIAAGSLALYALIYGAGPRLAHKAVAAGAALLYLTFPLLWASLGLDVALWMALGLAATWLYARDRLEGAALLLALATLMRPEIGALVAMLIADAVLRGRTANLLPLAIYGGLVALGLVWIGTSVTGGGLLPSLPRPLAGAAPPDAIGVNVLAGLDALARALWAISPLWAVVLGLAALGILRLRDVRQVQVLAGWAVLHLITLASFQAAVYPWHFAPLLPTLAAMAALGVEWAASKIAAFPAFRAAEWGQPEPDEIVNEARAGQVTRLAASAKAGSPRVRRVVGAVGALIALAAMGMSIVRLAIAPTIQASAWRALSAAPVEQGFVEAGAWLSHYTAPETRVGATRIGILGYDSDRFLLDYNGLLQPEIGAARQRGDQLWWLHEYLPQALVVRASEIEALADNGSGPDPWFATTYAEVARFPASPESSDAVVILARTANLPPLTPHLVGLVNYPEGIVLNGIATDFSLDPLDAGRMGRIRLEWLLEKPVDEPRYVSIGIQGRDGTYAALGGGRTIDFQNWPQRRLITTYHTLDLAPAVLPGVYDVQVGIGPDPFDLTWQPVAIAKVPFPEAAFVGAVSGARAEFGDIALLGYRLSSSPEQGLEVLLMWQAINPPRANYRMFIQVVDAQGALAAQAIVEPHGGVYPTSVWSPGERVPDLYTLDTRDLPPGEYTVYAGLLNPDGGRVITLDGQDAVLVGRVMINREQ